MRRVARAAGWAALVGLAGCADGPRTGQVRGRVTMDGQPVVAGMIRFVPLDPGASGGGGAVKDGRYDVKVPAARHRVELNGVKVGANGKPIAAGDSVEELFPPKYNLKSELVAEVKAGVNDLDYDLRGK